MKNLLKLLSILAISTPIPLTVVACGDKKPAPTPTSKIDLKTKITSLTTDITANVNKNNNELDTQIKSTNKIKSLNPNLTNPTIKYFSDSQGKTNVSNQKQKAGDLYVVITANDNDKSYQGSTIIDITKQTNISDIDMQNYFKKKTLPLATFTPENPSTPSTVNKQEAVENVISILKKIQKNMKQRLNLF